VPDKATYEVPTDVQAWAKAEDAENSCLLASSMETLPQDRMQRWARGIAGMTISWIPQITAIRRDKPQGSQAAAQQPMTEEDEKKRKATVMCDKPRILLQILL
jgi:hypothetical protein